MKASSSGRKLSRAAARNAMLLNQLATPGLGSLMARHWVAGIGQLLIFLAGFVIYLLWFVQEMRVLLAALNGSDAVVPPLVSGRQLLTGAALALLSWCWALVTSWQIQQAARTAETPLPPVISSTWQRREQTISRTFRFPDFPAAIRFVNAVALRAEAAQHHPDIDIRWNQVTLTLTTHDAGGLTEKDFALARECDALVAEIPPIPSP